MSSSKEGNKMRIEVIGVEGIPIVKEGDDIASMILEAAEAQGTPIQEGDIVVITHVVVSRIEGRTVDLRQVKPSKVAENFAAFTGKDPRLVEVILQNSRAVRRMRVGLLVTETPDGVVCANSGVDVSNVSGGDVAAPLPEDADASAKRIKERLSLLSGKEVAVIVCDSHGRAFRLGAVNVAIGLHGLSAIWDRRGEKDLFGYQLKVKEIAVADELASAAELVIGQADEGVPVAIIRGYPYKKSVTSMAKDLVRPRELDVFI